MKLSSAQLAVMCEGVPVKRAMDKRYRYCAPSGKLVRPAMKLSRDMPRTPIGPTRNASAVLLVVCGSATWPR